MSSIGVILVHGIGEQRRFAHLDGQVRDLIRSLQSRPDVLDVSVDIAGAGAAAFHAEQDTWGAGSDASVTVAVRHKLNGQVEGTTLHIHEVWWADVNESYSLAKQIRFWLWGLAAWAQPAKYGSQLGTADRMVPPLVRNQPVFWDRTRLVLTGAFFSLVGFSVGAVTVLLTRLFQFKTPDVLRTLTNYLSAVKLYNQKRRHGPGFFGGYEEFLDSVGEPPRVSVRRRMIRTIADVVCNDYGRWYVLAHSQGSVVAFNGLMETAYAWPGYLDVQRWKRLVGAGMAGAGAPTMTIPAGPFMPRRPVWAAPNEIAYRSRIFSRFHGILTYGSPLQKFAGLWPALVPITREPAFAPTVRWINLYDPIDPVSGLLSAFRQQPVQCCPHPQDIGYAADNRLLIAHLKYLTHRGPDDAASATVTWLLTDSPAGFPAGAQGKGLGSWFVPAGGRHKLRSAGAWLTWAIVAALLALLSAVILPLLLLGTEEATAAIWKAVAKLLP